MPASDTFIVKYGACDLPYTAEIIGALGGGSARVLRAPEAVSSASALELLHIYEGRAKHLSRFSTRHAIQLRRDVEAFCANLKTKKSDRCAAWMVECAPHFIYDLWEWVPDGGFIGVIKTVDDRWISESERAVLWGAKNA